ncbi:MAG: amino acid adenylation domain-containing protein [Bacteroidales bacterium]|jgi:D-alanine--poly(phosphoribitol) ligase subunit 1|nr:amino acid adenylation domain-containing protein [Bacteroidales bacterium]
MYNYNLGLLFYSIAAEEPDNSAILFSENEKVNFQELNCLSNQIARYLLDLKVNKNDVVGIFNNKTKESYALMLACLKTGAIYVNLDDTSPFERLKKIIDRCNPVLLAYDQEALLNTITDFKIPLLDIFSKSFFTKLETYSNEDLDLTSLISSDNPAYIMFTSGSTGFPKGAVMTHQNLLNFVNWTKQTYHIEKDDILTNVNPMFFDNSVFDFYASLFNGAAMAPVAPETVKQAAKLVSYVDKIKATIWFSVPSLLVFLITMKALTSDVFKNVKVITFGGEGFPKSKLKILFDLFADRIRIVNVYGPTECTCICSAYDVNAEDFKDMINLAPLGHMAPNFDYLILDESNNEAKYGELALAGPQVGPGYYNDTERTEKSFIQHPFIKNYRKIIYKTGDIVREDDNGIIHILGRSDNQIKHMGYRIELEEIEAGFNLLEYINQTGVVYEKFEDGLGQIKAFVTLKSPVSVESIREDIKKILPPYMIPRIIKILDTMPLNQSGKIDRIVLKSFK